MSKIKIAAVLRAGIFSPNHVGNDAAILNAAADEIRKRGYEVTIYSEEQFVHSTGIDADVFLNMCRTDEAINKLCELEEQGKLVVNSGFGITNCSRDLMTRLLTANGIPYPLSVIVDTNENTGSMLANRGIDRCWVKKGSGYAMHKEDVHYCRHAQEAQEICHEFYYRGIKSAVINKHLDGDLVKFYGLSDGSFFYWFYPLLDNHSKFGDELNNGLPEKYGFDEKKLLQDCLKASDVIGVQIFGGDCIVDSEGHFQIIDFNDWPSFAPCRKEAAKAIAKLVIKEIKKRFPEEAAPARRTQRRAARVERKEGRDE